MNSIIEEIVSRAKADKQNIILPEGTEERTLKAADQIIRDGVANITLLGNPTEIEALAKKLNLNNISKAKIIDPKTNPDKQKYADLLFELRKKKGMTPEQAITLAENPLYLACLMIKNGDADGEVAGAFNTTGNVLRPALQIIKTRPGHSSVSGAFILFTKAKQYGNNGIFIFADCAVIPNPTAQELAEIAVSSAETARNIVGMEPYIAMLSFSSKGSGFGEEVDKVVEAVKIVKENHPSLKIDGELQLDAALVPTVTKLKAPGSEIEGKTNVLVFPSLAASNIGYKLVERLGDAEAVGPILQGIAAPVNDLSRGCSIDDIYKMIAITANQSIALKKNK